MIPIPPQVAGFLSKYGIWLGIAALMVTILFTAYCAGKTAGKNIEVLEQQEREIETQRDLGEANETAAGARVEDAKREAAQEKELTDALQATDDPVRQRTLRGCIIMQQQGRDTADIPACRRLETER